MANVETALFTSIVKRPLDQLQLDPVTDLRRRHIAQLPPDGVNVAMLGESSRAIDSAINLRS